MKTTIYTPDSGLRNPVKLIKELVADLRSESCRDLAWRLIVRNISSMYRQSFFGYIWIFIPPVMTALVWIFLNQQQVINMGETDIPYPFYVLSGNLIWLGFATSLTAPIMAVNRERGLLTKINFPREALLIAGFVQLAVNIFVPMIVLIPAMFVFGVHPTWTLALFPLAVLTLALFGFSLGLLVTPFALFFNDISQAIPILARFLFFMTPVVYPPPTEGLISIITRFNPVAPMLMVSRDLLTGHELRMLPQFWVVFGCTMVFLFIGLVMYRLAMPHAIERMSA